MNTSLLTLLGITFSTLCASICPMNTGMMPMDMGEMHMAGHVMDHDMTNSQECETCDKETEDIAFINLSVESQQVAFAQNIVMTTVALVADDPHLHTIKPIPIDTGPPPLSEILVGTLILRV